MPGPSRRTFLAPLSGWVAGLAVGLVAAGLVLARPASAQCELLELDAHQSHFDNFGMAVAMNAEFAVAGSPGDALFGAKPGAAYVFRHADGGTPFDHSDDTWPYLAKLLASDGAAQDLFGISVALEGDTLLVGASQDDDSGTNSGSAYVFRRDDHGTPGDTSDDTWAQQAKLLGSPVVSGDDFGRAVALGPDFALVGNPRDWNQSGSGSAFLFRRDDGGTPGDTSDDSWVQHVELVPSGPSGLLTGAAVDLEGDYAILGAESQTRAYVFRRDDNGTPADFSDDLWPQAAVLQPSDPPSEQFGHAVALDGDFALVSAADDWTLLGETGSAYVFRRDDAGTPGDPGDDTWIEEAKLIASDAVDGESFGRAVALDGDTALVGSLRATLAFSGAAYLFRRDEAGEWAEQAHLVPSASAAADGYGEAVALLGGFALIGAPYAEVHASNDGTVYVEAVARAPWSWLGSALAGTQGQPCLAGAGTLQPGQPVGFTLHAARPDAPVVFIIGTDSLNAPFKGGVLVPELDLLVFGLSTNAAGKIALSSSWPAGLPPAFDTTYYQVWIVDPAGPAGFAASNCLLGSAP